MEQEIYKDGKLVLVSCIIVTKNNELLLLYRTEHNHFETAGGRMQLSDLKDKNKITMDDLKKAAVREGKEELGDVEFSPLKHFVSVEFKIPDGRNAVAHKFLTAIKKGTPKIMEPERFSKIELVPIKTMKKYPLSPDLKLLVPNFNDYLKSIETNKNTS
ncbi:NUDIX hydrolase [Candidatus Woesearchaeota archaeon]|nr:NUDIX hydrolase [Candidatus Woesearchaeota archaeon]